jgi:hypothetical protein
MTEASDYLLSELASAKGDCARLRRRIRQLESSRAYWQNEARTWRYAARTTTGALYRRAEDVSATRSAEASSVG